MDEMLEPGGFARRLLLRRALERKRGGAARTAGVRGCGGRASGGDRQLHLLADPADGEGRRDRDVDESRRHATQRGLSRR